MQRSVASRAVASGPGRRWNRQPATRSSPLRPRPDRPRTMAAARTRRSRPRFSIISTVPGRDVRIALGFVRDEVDQDNGQQAGAVRLWPRSAARLLRWCLEQKREMRRAAASPARCRRCPHRPARIRAAIMNLPSALATREAWDSFLSVHTSGFYADLGARAARQAGGASGTAEIRQQDSRGAACRMSPGSLLRPLLRRPRCEAAGAGAGCLPSCRPSKLGRRLPGLDRRSAVLPPPERQAAG